MTFLFRLTLFASFNVMLFITGHTSFASTVDVESVSLMKGLKNRITTFIKNSFVNKTENLTSVYDITVTDLYGKDVHLSKYKGKVLLIVNYAEHAFVTKSNVENLSRLALKYGPQGFQVLIFLGNHFYEFFGGNEPGIRLKEAHPEFDVFSEVYVNGFSAHLIYKYLRTRLPRKTWQSNAVTTSFFKFLIDRNGKPYARFNSFELFETIEEALKKVLIKDFIPPFPKEPKYKYYIINH